MTAESPAEHLTLDSVHRLSSIKAYTSTAGSRVTAARQVRWGNQTTFQQQATVTKSMSTCYLMTRHTGGIELAGLLD